MFNSVYNHLVYSRHINSYALIDDMVGLGGSEHIALFANDQSTPDESSVESQRMPIIVKNIPNNAPMGNTVVPLQNIGFLYGSEQYDLLGYYGNPPDNIDYTNALTTTIFNAYSQNSPNEGVFNTYFFPDKNIIFYVLFGINVTPNSSHTVNMDIKLAVATQNAITGEIVDEQLFELPELTNIVIDLSTTSFYNNNYGFKILGTNYYCVFSEYTWTGDLRSYLFITLKTDSIVVNGKSWPVLRDPQLFAKSHVQNNFKNWIGHIVVNNQTYVCIQNQHEPTLNNFGSSVLAIGGSTNTVSKYICNYAFKYES